MELYFHMYEKDEDVFSQTFPLNIYPNSLNVTNLVTLPSEMQTNREVRALIAEIIVKEITYHLTRMNPDTKKPELSAPIVAFKYQDTPSAPPVIAKGVYLKSLMLELNSTIYLNNYFLHYNTVPEYQADCDRIVISEVMSGFGLGFFTVTNKFGIMSSYDAHIPSLIRYATIDLLRKVANSGERHERIE